ncbi:hypothetical protein [Fluviicola sp.]|uniref:hypothetical protein n=1 Tax=Fluviicola sp. TaxID=1917219 RepID=UPI0031E19E01
MKQSSFLILILALVLHSCSTETKKSLAASDELKKYILERYQTSDVTATIGKTFKNGKTESTFEISVGKSTLIDNSKSDPEQFASDIALRLYSSLDQTERRKYDIFAVRITKKNRTTEIRYPNNSLQEATNNLTWLEGYFLLIDDKEYENAKLQFDPGVDTASLDLKTLYETLSNRFGELKNRDLQSFTIGETQMNGKTVRAMKATYILFYEKHYLLTHYILLMDKPGRKLTAIDVE